MKKPKSTIKRLEEYIVFKERLSHFVKNYLDRLENEHIGDDALMRNLSSYKWFNEALVYDEQKEYDKQTIFELAIAWGKYNALEEVISLIYDFDNPSDESGL